MGEVCGGVQVGDHPQCEGESDAVPALNEARVVAPAAAELAEGLPVDGSGEALRAGPQPALKQDVDHMLVQLAPNGVIGLEGGCEYVVGNPQKRLQEGVPRFGEEA